MIRVVIVDDHALFRDGLRAVLTAHGVEVAGEAGDGAEAVELVRTLRPDVVLMDLRMPGVGGVEATRRIQALTGPPRVLVLTTFDDDESVFDAVRAGAVGYLLKDARAAQLIEAIEVAAQGESYLPPAIAAKLVGEFARLPARERPGAGAALGLSEREIAVLRALCAGRANKEIATALGITEGTVKNHVTSILGKLGVGDRTQAALKARALGIG